MVLLGLEYMVKHSGDAIRLPVAIKVPNETTMAAIMACEAGELEKFESLDDSRQARRLRKTRSSSNRTSPYPSADANAQNSILIFSFAISVLSKRSPF